MIFHGTIQKGELTLSNMQVELKKQFLTSMKDGTLVIMEIKKFYPHKTQEQLGAIFGLALQQIETEFDDRGWDCSIIMRLSRPTGVPVNKDMLKQFFYSLFPVFDDSGRQITLSKMNTVQASDYFENIRNFASSQWSIVIDDPDPRWRELKDDTEQ